MTMPREFFELGKEFIYLSSFKISFCIFSVAEKAVGFVKEENLVISCSLFKSGSDILFSAADIFVKNIRGAF